MAISLAVTAVPVLQRLLLVFMVFAVNTVHLSSDALKGITALTSKWDSEAFSAL